MVLMAMLTYLLVDMATVNTYASVFVTYAMDVFIRTRGALEHSTSTPACHPAATFVQPSCNLRAASCKLILLNFLKKF